MLYVEFASVVLMCCKDHTFVEQIVAIVEIAITLFFDLDTFCDKIVTLHGVYDAVAFSCVPPVHVGE